MGDSKIVVWNIGKLAGQENKAEGTLTYATDPKDGSSQRPCDTEKCTAQLAFVIKGWAISGMRLDSCEVSSVSYSPYKASRYTTTTKKVLTFSPFQIAVEVQMRMLKWLL